MFGPSNAGRCVCSSSAVTFCHDPWHIFPIILWLLAHTHKVFFLKVTLACCFGGMNLEKSNASLCVLESAV